MSSDTVPRSACQISCDSPMEDSLSSDAGPRSTPKTPLLCGATSKTLLLCRASQIKKTSLLCGAILSKSNRLNDTGHSRNPTNNKNSKNDAFYKKLKKNMKKKTIKNSVVKSCRKTFCENVKKYFWLKCNYCNKIVGKNHLMKTCPAVGKQKNMCSSSTSKLNRLYQLSLCIDPGD